MNKKSSWPSSSGAQTVAVALKQRSPTLPDGPALPQITAKGRGAVADQILQIAFDTGVKVREDADLAETLEALELDSDVPVAAIGAIAEILSYVYRANGMAAPPEPEEAP